MGDFSERIRLTERTVAAAKPAREKSAGGHPVARYYLDTELKGFGLSVSFPSENNPTGTKSYFVLRAVHGKQQRHVFRRASETTVAEARALAAKLLSKMTDGVDLNQQRRDARVEASRDKVRGITLGQALKLLEGGLRAKGRSERTMEGYRNSIDTYLAAWVDRPLVEITRAEVRKRHGDIQKEIARGKYSNGKAREAGAGKASANSTMRAFRAVWNRAMRENPELPISPTINVDWNQQQRRTGRIPRLGMKAWYDEVQGLTNTVRRDYLLFVLFTGLRRESATTVKWEDVDFKRKALHVPLPKGGAARAFDLPLSDYLVALLKRRQKENEVLAPESHWVFPAARGDGHIVEVRLEGSTYTVKASRKKKAEAKPRYTVHDLRRTFTSETDTLGISTVVSKLLVNHAVPSDVHSGYIVPEFSELMTHMQRISTHLLTLCEPPPSPKPTRETDNVVSIRKKVAA